MKTVALRLVICFWLAVSVGTIAAAQETADAVMLQAKQARDQGDVAALQTLIRNAQGEAGPTRSFDANLRIASLNAWLVEAGLDHNNEKVVKQAAEDGIAAAERAVQLNAKSSEAHRLVGGLLGVLIPHVFAGGVRYGRHSTAEIEKAMQLDPQNANAYLARGIAYFFTPKIFGGDKDKAVEMLKKAIAVAPASDVTEAAHIWLARVYQSLGKKADATSEINEALRMNPDRLSAKVVQGELSPK